jgi:hypothetical protein
VDNVGTVPAALTAYLAIQAFQPDIVISAGGFAGTGRDRPGQGAWICATGACFLAAGCLPWPCPAPPGWRGSGLVLVLQHPKLPVFQHADCGEFRAAAGTAGGFRSRGASIADVFVSTSMVNHDRRIPIPVC